METAKPINKNETPNLEALLPAQFILDFFKLIKTYTKIKQELKDNILQERFEIYKIIKEKILYFDLTGTWKSELRFLVQFLLLFPNIVQINFSSSTEIKDTKNCLVPEIVQCLDKPEYLNSLELGALSVPIKNVSHHHEFFKRLVHFESVGRWGDQSQLCWENQEL